MGDVQSFALTQPGQRPLRGQILQVLLASHDYAMATWRIARMLDAPSGAIRRELRRMEAEGLVRVIPQWSTVNNLIWKAEQAAAQAVQP